MKVNDRAEERRVFVGLSGGVDSAVTAALLRDSGAAVTGVFIQGWYPPGLPCSWAADRRDAMRVAAHLGIPFVTLDASAEYKAGVIDYLIREYRAGRTPNPDVMCNREVKFGAFHRFAKEHGADAIATGHYARTEGGRLFRGIDDGKDQSYFLWAVPKEALADTVLPLGGMHKAEVRKLAEKYRLPNAAKKDSQGICFLGSISVEDFLRAELAPEEGKTLDGVGNEIGSHGGAVLYTLGERIVLEGSASGPWYVVAKDLAANTVTVAHEISSGGARHSLKLTEMNWLGSDDGESAGKVGGGVGEGVVGEEAEREVEAQYRYHGPRIKGAMRGDSFIPAEPLAEPVASGQSLVSYQGNECVGGGIIT